MTRRQIKYHAPDLFLSVWAVFGMIVLLYPSPPRGAVLGGESAVQDLPSGRTKKTSVSDLEAVLKKPAPESISDLRTIEIQLKKITDQIRRSTVGVRIGRAQGSGVIISKDGYVLTAAHVTGSPGRSVVLTLSDGKQLDAITLGLNRKLDAALLKITETGEWPFSEMGDSEPVNWIWFGYLAAGFISLLTGLWKAGKTTLLAHVIRACGGGGDVGSKVEPCRVLLVTEEPHGMWSRRRDDLGIGDHAHCIARPFMSKPSHGQWRAFIRHIVELTTEHIYGLIIFDTLGSVAPYQNENDAAEMQATLMPLQAIADTGAAVLLVHHPRKGDGQEGQASRGSGALTGFVDCIIELRRYSRTDRSDSRRTLTTFSRLDESPPEVVVELTDDGFISLGSRSDANKADRAVTLLDILTTDGLTVKEIKAAWDEQDATPPSEKTIRNDLEYGFSKARWLRAGAGTRGDPFTYRLGERVQT